MFCPQRNSDMISIPPPRDVERWRDAMIDQIVSGIGIAVLIFLVPLIVYNIWVKWP